MGNVRAMYIIANLGNPMIKGLPATTLLRQGIITPVEYLEILYADGYYDGAELTAKQCEYASRFSHCNV
ncbi:hypothetical protein SAMN05216391_10891 [Lachnospiraceae bacterium KHCPX20]|nr:hypothetical protein SAMN05216391_10891 [Lachnospiraceae bacterium KHCPX20]